MNASGVVAAVRRALRTALGRMPSRRRTGEREQRLHRLERVARQARRDARRARQQAAQAEQAAGRDGRQVAALRARVVRLEADMQEARALNKRLAEVTDVVAEVLLPAGQRDEERLRQILQGYADTL